MTSSYSYTFTFPLHVFFGYLLLLFGAAVVITPHRNAYTLHAYSPQQKQGLENQQRQAIDMFLLWTWREKQLVGDQNNKDMTYAMKIKKNP